MSKIRKVLICGLGGVGSIYAQRFVDNTDVELKILVNADRLKKYIETPRQINGKEYRFDYILPDNNDFKADLVIIAVKSSGLEDTISNLKNFITDDTIILSFINGITSEEKIATVYGYDKILYSYVICHTIFRTGSNVTHDGVTKVVFGAKDKDNDKVQYVKEIFELAKIDYEIPDDMYRALWLKFALNCCVNQTSVVTNFTFSQMYSSEKCLSFMKQICKEISDIACKVGVKNTDTFWEETLKNLYSMLPEGKTSMLQDMEAQRKPEIDLFGKTVIQLGKTYNIQTPNNEFITKIIEILSEHFM